MWDIVSTTPSSGEPERPLRLVSTNESLTAGLAVYLLNREGTFVTGWSLPWASSVQTDGFRVLAAASHGGLVELAYDAELLSISPGFAYQ